MTNADERMRGWHSKCAPVVQAWTKVNESVAMVDKSLSSGGWKVWNEKMLRWGWRGQRTAGVWWKTGLRLRNNMASETKRAAGSSCDVLNKRRSTSLDGQDRGVQQMRASEWCKKLRKNCLVKGQTKLEIWRWFVPQNAITNTKHTPPSIALLPPSTTPFVIGMLLPHCSPDTSDDVQNLKPHAATIANAITSIVFTCFIPCASSSYILFQLIS